MEFFNKIMVVALIIIVLMLGAPILWGAVGEVQDRSPDFVSRADNGVDLLTNYYEQGPSVETGAELVRYLVLPFLLVWTLIYGVLEGGGGRYLPNKVIMPLSVLLSMTSVFSGAFVTISLAVNYFGALGIFFVGFYVLFLGVGAFVREKNWEHKSAIERMNYKESYLQSEADRLGKKILKNLKKSNHGGFLIPSGVGAVSSDYNNDVQRFVGRSLTDLDNLKKDMKKVRKKVSKKEDDAHSLRHDHKILKYMGNIVNLSKKFNRIDAKEEKAVNQNLKD